MCRGGLFRKARYAFFENALKQDSDGFVVAEDDDLACVLNRVIAASCQFVLERRPADGCVDVSATASHNAAVAGRFGIEDLLHPNFRRQGCSGDTHPSSLPSLS